MLKKSIDRNFLLTFDLSTIALTNGTVRTRDKKVFGRNLKKFIGTMFLKSTVVFIFFLKEETFLKII